MVSHFRICLVFYLSIYKIWVNKCEPGCMSSLFLVIDMALGVKSEPGDVIAIYRNVSLLAECTTHLIFLHFDNLRDKKLQNNHMTITWKLRHHYVELCNRKTHFF